MWARVCAEPSFRGLLFLGMGMSCCLGQSSRQGPINYIAVGALIGAQAGKLTKQRAQTLMRAEAILGNAVEKLLNAGFQFLFAGLK